VQSEDESEYDLDLTPVDFLELNRESTEIQAWSQELRLTSNNDGPLRYTGGLFYAETERDRFTDVEVIPFVLNLLADASDANTAWAAFAQINYDITDDFELTLAGRYDVDDREQINNLVAPADPDYRVSEEFTMLQPKVSLAYALSSDVTLYATAAQGFRSGGFNTPGPVFERVYDSEETTNFEVGLKSILFDGHLSLNVALYSILYENQQVQLLDLGTGQQGIVNIPETESQGVEVEFAARLTDNLTFSGGVGYLDSEITEFTALPIVEGNRPPFAPEFTYNIALDYTAPFSGEWDLVLRAALSGQSGMYYEYYSRETNGALPYTLSDQPAYTLVDLRATLRGPTWTLTAFADNALDAEYYPDASSNLITGFGDVAVQGRTRRYGVEIGYRF
jgi:iron complex outermembrane receptor protein